MAGGWVSGSESPDTDSQSSDSISARRSIAGQLSNADDESSDSINIRHIRRAIARQHSNSNPPQARGRLHRYTELGRELGRKLEVWKPYICSGCQRYLLANNLKPEPDENDWYRYDDEKRELVQVRRWMSTRHCGMCKLLTQLVADHDEIDSKRKTCLLVPQHGNWPRKPILKNWPHRYDATVTNLAYTPWPRPRHLNGRREKARSDGYGVKLLDRNKVDFDHVKNWIKACEYHHWQQWECRSPRNLSRVLRVIDCQTKKLITKPDDSEYLTLSYVPPRVVRDAMAVTLKLGYQYLWVDKYCIDQTDVAGKMAEIAIMDQIYENAILTIVDAAGDHDDYGLVFCGTTPLRRREKQPVARVGSRTYTWTSLRVASVVNSSPWVTRGWTFQEGLLSTRCLFFTKKQVYFVCKKGSECETVPHRPSADYFKHNIKLSNLFKTGQSMDSDTGSEASLEQDYLVDLINLIDMYAARSLTDDSDALNAFRGILARCHLHTYWGIPFIEFKDLLRFRRTEMLPADFSDPGNVTAGFLAGLAWMPTTRVTKHRTCMSSWSWLGIPKVSVKFALDNIIKNDGDDETLSIRNATYEISAMTHPDGLDTAEPIIKIWREAENWVIPELSQYIKITAPAAKVVGIKWRRPVRGAFEALLPIELSIQGSKNKTWTLDCDTRQTWLRLKKASRQSTEIPLDLKVVWLKHRYSQPPCSEVIKLYLVLQRHTECHKRIGRIHWRSSAPAELLSTRVETMVLG
ncbi:hypothetical protein VTL71DRAFT_9513 [Oculimacula yallundae]|uniref:Heterokaryon incompatibility domain-containing protein n=1 Tax=Oculimacula yallundae TaxID=86028 RepID=A0ABR4BSY2_9HELO